MNHNLYNSDSKELYFHWRNLQQLKPTASSSSKLTADKMKTAQNRTDLINCKSCKSPRANRTFYVLERSNTSTPWLHHRYTPRDISCIHTTAPCKLCMPTSHQICPQPRPPTPPTQPSPWLLLKHCINTSSLAA